MHLYLCLVLKKCQIKCIHLKFMKFLSKFLTESTEIVLLFLSKKIGFQLLFHVFEEEEK